MFSAHEWDPRWSGTSITPAIVEVVAVTARLTVECSKRAVYASSVKSGRKLSQEVFRHSLGLDLDLE